VTFEGSVKASDVVAPVPELLSVKVLEADCPVETLPKLSESGLAPSAVYVGVAAEVVVATYRIPGA
jgi:hypothetical protein